MFAWLTPDTIPGATVCRVLYIPADPTIIGAVNGAISALGYKENWELFGLIEPEAIADAMFAMYCDYQKSVCMPIGVVAQFAGTEAPEKWELCEGQELAQADYPELFAVIGNLYGAAGAGNFRLPDARGRAVAGAGNGAGLTPRALAGTWGQEQKTLSTANHAPHAHTIHQHLAGLALAPGELPVDIPNLIPGSTGSQGSGTPFDLSQPSLALNIIIRALR